MAEALQTRRNVGTRGMESCACETGHGPQGACSRHSCFGSHIALHRKHRRITSAIERTDKLCGTNPGAFLGLIQSYEMSSRSLSSPEDGRPRSIED